MKEKCKSCKHWNNRQAELEYSTHFGICTCYRWKFTISNAADVVLLDRNNRSEKHMGVQRFENQSNVVPIGKADVSRYCFVTEEEFGCIHHNKKWTASGSPHPSLRWCYQSPSGLLFPFLSLSDHLVLLLKLTLTCYEQQHKHWIKETSLHED